MGKFVICTDMWTFRDVLGDSRCAYYIKNNEPESIAAALDFCYKNRQHLKEWGREGVSIAKNKYTWQKQSERLIDFVSQLRKTKKHEDPDRK